MDADKEVPAAEEPLTGVATVASKIGARNLLIIIVTMPLVFLIVVMAVIAIAGKPGKDDTITAGAVRSTPADYAEVLEQPAPRTALAATPASLFADDPAPLVLPQGGKIGSMTLDGDRLAVRVDAAGGGEIVIYDVARGAVVQRIRVRQTGTEEDL